jgi:hypothetical protein
MKLIYTYLMLPHDAAPLFAARSSASATRLQASCVGTVAPMTYQNLRMIVLRRAWAGHGGMLRRWSTLVKEASAPLSWRITCAWAKHS